MATIHALILVGATLATANLAPAEPRRQAPSLVWRWRELSRRVSPLFVTARDRGGHTATGLLVKITLLRF